MQIETLKEQDLSAFAEIYVEFIESIRDIGFEIYYDYKPEMKEKMERVFSIAIKKPEWKIFVAKEKNKIIGFIAGDIRQTFFPYSKIEKIGYISAVYIAEEFRKEGLARKFEKKICDEFFSKHNIKYLELHCLTNNISAKKCWNNMGYETFREQLRKTL
jgi:ribosomal protein S18 acetylase RimI-like enzyme